MLTGKEPGRDPDRSELCTPDAGEEVEDCGCCTKAVGDGYSECLMNRPECVYAKPFGYTSLCRHRCHREFRNHK